MTELETQQEPSEVYAELLPLDKILVKGWFSLYQKFKILKRFEQCGLQNIGSLVWKTII